jgi:hypothetical protein
MKKYLAVLAAGFLSACLVLTGGLSASATQSFSVNAISCGGLKVRINSTGTLGGFHTLYTSPGVGTSMSFSGIIGVSEARTKFALHSSMYSGGGTRDGVVYSSYRECV